MTDEMEQYVQELQERTAAGSAREAALNAGLREAQRLLSQWYAITMARPLADAAARELAVQTVTFLVDPYVIEMQEQVEPQGGRPWASDKPL